MRGKLADSARRVASCPPARKREQRATFTVSAMTSGDADSGRSRWANGALPAWDELRRDEERQPYAPLLGACYWDLVGPFVDRAVAAAGRRGAYTDRELILAAAPLTLWAWQSLAVPLELEEIFDRDVVEQYVALGMPGRSRGTRATMRSRLLCICDALRVPPSAGQKQRPIPRADPAAPYSEEDLAGLYGWATQQPTRTRRASAVALLALGLGAGLATRDLLTVRGEDLVITGSGVRVQVWGERERVVALTDLWGRVLTESAGDYDPDRHVFCPDRARTHSALATNFIQTTRTSLDVRPTRMRATWIVGQLIAGTPALALLRSAGLAEFGALNKFQRFLPPSAGLEL